MTEDAEHVIDDLAAYALGALEPAESARIDRHIATCASCASRLLQYRGLIGVLPLALTPLAPAPDLWTTIRAELRPRDGSAVWTRRSIRSTWLRRAGWLTAAAIGALVITWNLHVHTELARYAEGPQVEKLARRPARLVILTGAARPEASARIFAAVDGQSGHMAVVDLPPLPQHRVYQLWFLPKAASPAQKAATFNVDSEGRAWVVIKVPASLDDIRAIVVTDDPAGSPTPTGPPLLEAQQWR